MGTVMSWDQQTRQFLPFRGQNSPLRELFAEALRRSVAHSRSPAKELARRIGRTPKAAARILAGDNAPQLDAIVAACREFDEAWSAMRALCGREPADAERVLETLAAALRERKR